VNIPAQIELADKITRWQENKAKLDSLQDRPEPAIPDETPVEEPVAPPWSWYQKKYLPKEVPPPRPEPAWKSIPDEAPVEESVAEDVPNAPPWSWYKKKYLSKEVPPRPARPAPAWKSIPDETPVEEPKPKVSLNTKQLELIDKINKWRASKAGAGDEIPKVIKSEPLKTRKRVSKKTPPIK